MKHQESVVMHPHVLAPRHPVTHRSSPFRSEGVFTTRAASRPLALAVAAALATMWLMTPIARAGGSPAAGPNGANGAQGQSGTDGVDGRPPGGPGSGGVQGDNGSPGTYGGYGQSVSGGTPTTTGAQGGSGGQGGTGGDGGKGGAGGEGYVSSANNGGNAPIYTQGGLGGPGGDGGSSVSGSTGGAGLIVSGGSVTLTGPAKGGDGGAGGDGGGGGKGGTGGDGYGGNLGGTGGNGANGSNGNTGGDGLLLVGGTVTNAASIEGGKGGSGGAGGGGGDAGNGGKSLGADAFDMIRIDQSLNTPPTSLYNSPGYPGAAGATGGLGGYGGNGGNGGNGAGGGLGALLTGGTLINTGSITGGTGGDGGSGGQGGGGGDGGTGGNAVFGRQSTAFLGCYDGVAPIDGGCPEVGPILQLGEVAPQNGGAGGSGGSGGNGGNGGIAGAGSAGVQMQNATLINTGTIVGGQGGQQGAGGGGGDGGSGGAGGKGADGTPGFVNDSLPPSPIPADAGEDGADGASGSVGAFGAAGVAGVGVLGEGAVTVVNAGTIEGGKSNGGSGPRADAVLLQGTGNTLVLEAGSQINGAVVSQGTNTLALGGDQNAPAGNTFNLTTTSAGGQYQGFTNFGKTGSSTWTVTGDSTFSGGTTVSGGTLVMGTGSHLGGTISVDAGATLKTSNTNVVWTDTVTNNGAYLSDPSTQTFTTLDIGSSGYLQGGAGDVFDVTNNFFNQSTQRSQWDTTLATLIFSGIPGTSHLSSLAGLVGAGFSNNFGWGTLQLGTGNSLDLTDGSGNAFYVNYLDLQGGLGQLSDLTASNGVVLYYNLDNPQNAYLQGAAYNLEGGGSLSPYVSMDTGGTGNSVPEPGTLALLAAGLLTLALAPIRRRKAQRLRSDLPL